MKLFVHSLEILAAMLLVAASSHAQVEANDTTVGKSVGGNSGGGGDGPEMRIDDIRSDILRWINRGGHKTLVLPDGLTADEYARRMKEVLAPKFVVVSTVTTEQEQQTDDPEQRVSIDGTEKTCRGFISQKDSRPHILCNSERLESTLEDAQYRLIHHEYGGLAGVEKNEGAASDYAISNQLQRYLKIETVMRLSIEPQVDPKFSPLGSCVSARGDKIKVFIEPQNSRNEQRALRKGLISMNGKSFLVRVQGSGDLNSFISSSFDDRFDFSMGGNYKSASEVEDAFDGGGTMAYGASEAKKDYRSLAKLKKAGDTIVIGNINSDDSSIYGSRMLLLCSRAKN
jgi:hypothetical protein